MRSSRFSIFLAFHLFEQQSYSVFFLLSFFNLSRLASRHVSFRMQTTNNSSSTMSSPVTALLHSRSGSTPAPLANTPAPPPSQPVSLLDNNSLAQAISRALADSFPSLLSSLRDYSGGNTNMTAMSGSFISASNSTQSPASSSSVTPSSTSQISGTLVVPSYFNS